MQIRVSYCVWPRRIRGSATVPSAVEIRDGDGGGDLITRINRHNRGDVPGNCRLRIALGIASDREVVTRNLAAPDHWQSSMRQFFLKIWTEGGYKSSRKGITPYLCQLSLTLFSLRRSRPPDGHGARRLAAINLAGLAHDLSHQPPRTYPTSNPSPSEILLQDTIGEPSCGNEFFNALTEGPDG